MHIEVNIWLPSTTIFGHRIKNKFGVFFSQLTHEHTGHANLIVIVPENSPSFAKLEENPMGLVYQKTLRYTPVRVTSEKALSQTEEGIWRSEITRADTITHSFWPREKPKLGSVIQDLLHLLHLSKPNKGTKPFINSHEDDRKQESGKSDFKSVIHRTNLRKKESSLTINTEKSALIYEASDLELALENKVTLEEKVSTLTIDNNNLLSQQKSLAQTHVVKQDNFAFQIAQHNQQRDQLRKKEKIIRNLLTHLITRDDGKKSEDYLKFDTQLNDLLSQLELLDTKLAVLELYRVNEKEEYCKQSNALKSKLKQNNIELKTAQHDLGILGKEINGRTIGRVKHLQTLLKKHIDMEQRQRNYQIELTESKGKAPDHSIQLPTQTSGLRYYVDLALVIDAMRSEQAQNYSLIFNNCVSSTKRCLIAGITPIKDKLIKYAHFTAEDFTIKTAEDPKLMREWTKKLEAGLTHLNLNSLNIDAEQENHPSSPALNIDSEQENHSSSPALSI